jgi:hypothetical protein
VRRGRCGRSFPFRNDSRPAALLPDGASWPGRRSSRSSHRRPSPPLSTATGKLYRLLRQIVRSDPRSPAAVSVATRRPAPGHSKRRPRPDPRGCGAGGSDALSTRRAEPGGAALPLPFRRRGGEVFRAGTPSHCHSGLTRRSGTSESSRFATRTRSDIWRRLTTRPSQGPSRPRALTCSAPSQC